MEPITMLKNRRQNRRLQYAGIRIAVIIFFLYSSPFAQNLSISEKADKMLLMENYEGIVTMLDSVIQKDSSNFDAHYKISLAYQSLYIHDKAIMHLNRAKALSDNNSKVLSALGRSYSNIGAYDKAEEAYLEALKTDSTNKNISLSLARLYVDQQYYSKADKIYKQLLTLDQSNSYIYKQLGFCSMKQNDFKSSTEFYKKAYEFNKTDLTTVLQLSINYIKMNQLDSAEALVDKYLTIYPEDARFERLKGDILFRHKDYKNAHNYFSDVISKGDSSAYILQKLGFCLYFYAMNNDSLNANMKLVYYIRARSAFTGAAEQDTANPITLMYLAITDSKTGEFQKAIETMQKARDYSVSDIAPDICVYLGDYYKESKQYDKAIESYKDALHFAPEQIKLIFNIAEIYRFNLKDKKTASEYYELFLSQGSKLVENFESTHECVAAKFMLKSFKADQAKDKTQTKKDSVSNKVILH
ncbi:MAG: tetratricopeptide repeat protein [Bacteroidota bacterium]|nr:tetratricopeptide repeat protein [Bacteroidota bacterium]